MIASSALAACNSGNTGSSSGTESSGAASSEAESSGEESGSTSAGLTSDVVNGETNQQTYPLTEETVTLTYWYPNAGSMAELADFNDSYFFKWYEELTNVHIDFIVPAAGSEAEAFQLLFASDSMPDMVYSYPNQTTYSYRAGQDKAIEDGYFIDIAEYLDYAPNYLSWLANNDDLRKASYSGHGETLRHVGRLVGHGLGTHLCRLRPRESARTSSTKSGWRSRPPTPNGSGADRL